MLDISLPTKSVKFRPQIDKPYITKELKVLDRQRRREYRINGKSQKYLNLKENFSNKLKKSASAFLDKTSQSLRESDPGKAYSILKRMGAQPGDYEEDGSFVLPEHVSLGLTAAQSADRIAQKFADISPPNL